MEIDSHQDEPEAVMADPDDSGSEAGELTNDSIAHFDQHGDSVFAVAQHPLHPTLIATGGSEGDGDDDPGRAFLFDTSSVPSRPVLPASFAAEPQAETRDPVDLEPLFVVEGHADSVSALAFTYPRGDFLVTGGMDGKVQVLAVEVGSNPEVGGGDGSPAPVVRVQLVAETMEVPEVNWIRACPHKDHPDSFAFGASDGSVWVYEVDVAADPPLQMVQTYALHAASCTAGAWSSDGTLLATVAEDSSFYAWDVWGPPGKVAVKLTGDDKRFLVEGGLYSVAIEPRAGAFAAVGGDAGAIRIIGLPRLSEQPQGSSGSSSSKVGGKKAKAAGGGGGGGGGGGDPASGGQILASLQVQGEAVETLAFSTPTANPQQPILLAAGSVDGSIAVFDSSRTFATRRHIAGAHGGHAVVKVEFVDASWMLTSCGLDGVVRRWDLRQGGQTSGVMAPGELAGLVKEWKGHRGDGDGGGVLDFVQGGGERVVTAGDDGLALVFEA